MVSAPSTYAPGAGAATDPVLGVRTARCHVSAAINLATPSTLALIMTNGAATATALATG